MNQQQQDILTIISRHGPLRTVDICAHLEPLGYGGNMSYEQFKEYVGKIVSKMKAEHKVTSEKRPFPKSKPITYWSLPEGVNQQMTTEMASDVAEVEQGKWSDAKTFEYKPEQSSEIPEPDYDPSSVRFVMQKKPMSVSQAMQAYADRDYDDPVLGAFLEGIAAAERHHGIAE